MVMELAQEAEVGDILIDGGNSYYIDDIRPRSAWNLTGFHYLDIGTRAECRGLSESIA